MAVIENRTTAEGDVLIIKPENPVVGLLSLYQFVDTTTGESVTDYFKKEFRYSTDGGLTFQVWVDLNLTNIQAVSTTKYDQFVIEYRYIRVGITPDVVLSFENILVSGTFEALPYPTFKDTPFNDFFEVNNISVFGWALNVLEKLYRKGLILPDYIERAENNSNLEDEDFIVFWNSITHYFALIVYFARQFESFETNEFLLQEFLKNKDLAFSSNNDLADLLYIYSNYIDEYKKRGTLQVVRKKVSTGIDGELLRLINYKEFEEFVFCLFQNFESGWCIGKSSPTWRGTENIVNLKKSYESGAVTSLAAYPLLNPLNIDIYGGYLRITSIAADVFSGVADTAVPVFRIPVSPNEDYEISFRVKQSIPDQSLQFRLDSFRQDGSPTTLKNFNIDVPSNVFIADLQLNNANTEYWVRGILWNQNKVKTADSLLNIGVGNNLKSVSDVCYIVPVIGAKRTGLVPGVTMIRDIVVRPLNLNFSRGQLGVHNIIYLLMKNNNAETSRTLIKEHIENKLVPYNSFVKIKHL